MTDHALQQKKVIDAIDAQIQSNSFQFSVVPPTEDYEHDPRICLTTVHFLKPELVSQIQHKLLEPLRAIEPDYYCYPPESMHTTIKNIRRIQNPPDFTEADVHSAQKILTKVIPRHSSYTVRFYRLLLFLNNLALIGTTDPQLDDLVLDLDEELKRAGIPDNTQYANSRYFFSNVTLLRFSGALSEKFKNAVKELSTTIEFEPYTVDSISLVAGNAVFHNKKILGTWSLGK